VDPQTCVVLDGEALFAQDQHGATLVTAFGLATSSLHGSHCRLAWLFDEVAHDDWSYCESRASHLNGVVGDPASSRRETKPNHFVQALRSH
jgi:hypothetical protein